MTEVAERLVIRLDVELHPGQKAVHESPARFKVVACGRRWGKTKYGGLVCLFGDEHDSRGAVAGYAVWWVAPDYPRATIGWREIKGLARQIPGAAIREAERRIEFASGGFVQVKSAHVADALRGEGLDRLVIDEAAFMSEERWSSELRPALADRQGSALLLSTFNGENYFYDLYEIGQSEGEPEWESWRQPTSANPHIAPEEIEAARRLMPAAEFAQEFEANPLVYVGAVFPGEKVQEAVDRGAATEWDEDAETFAGLDWGYTNATAFCVCQESAASGRVSWLAERLWVATQLETRVASIVEMCREREIVAIYADAAGADENAALAEALQVAGLDTVVVPVPFGKFKVGGIKARRWYLEQGLEDLGARCPELIRTTKRYRYKEGSEDVEKVDDHPVDAATAFYASRRGVAVTGGALAESRA